jgi:hypothetical protein
LVTIEEIQAVYYMVAATGVLVAAAYYVFNMKQTMENKKAQLFAQITQITQTKDFLKDTNELMNLQWTDFDDFARKYDSAIDRDNYSKRAQMWTIMDSVGYYLKKRQIDIEQANTVMQGFYPIWVWGKYGDIIKRYRVILKIPTYYENFEYLVDQLVKYHKMRGFDYAYHGSGGDYFPSIV